MSAELWDRDTGNIIGAYASVDEAWMAALRSIEANPGEEMDLAVSTDFASPDPEEWTLVAYIKVKATDAKPKRRRRQQGFVPMRDGIDYDSSEQ